MDKGDFFMIFPVKLMERAARLAFLMLILLLILESDVGGDPATNTLKSVIRKGTYLGIVTTEMMPILTACPCLIRTICLLLHNTMAFLVFWASQIGFEISATTDITTNSAISIKQCRACTSIAPWGKPNKRSVLNGCGPMAEAFATICGKCYAFL